MQPCNLISTVLTLHIFREYFNMPSNLSYKRVSGSLEYQTDREIWVIFFLFKTSIRQPAFECDIAPLLHCQFFTHYFGHCYFTYYEFFLNEQLFFKIFIFLNHALES